MSTLRIAYIAAGAAGMYCGNCLHDNTLARAVIDMGHELLLIPTYTPLRTDEADQSLHKVYFGGINVYLQQKSALFRRLPGILDWLIDSPKLIDFFARRSMSVAPQDLGEMTLSMLHGEEGNQRKELDKLSDFLATEVKPHIVHLSNALLLGMARQLRSRLQVPVLCTVSGEDMFLDGLGDRYREQAHAALRERARDAAAFVSLNRYYADVMAQRLNVGTDRIHVVRHGLNLDGWGPRTWQPGQCFEIGYLARIAPEKGLHILAEALKILAADQAIPPVRVRAAGYLGKNYRGYLSEVLARVRQWGLTDRFEYVGEVDRAGKIAFLQSLGCLVMPTVYPESKGLPVVEAWACGTPVVVPRHGTFPELLADVDGGTMFEPENPESLAAELKRYIRQPELTVEYGNRAREAVHARYTARRMADDTIALYREVLEGVPQPTSAARTESTPPSRPTQAAR